MHILMPRFISLDFLWQQLNNYSIKFLCIHHRPGRDLIFEEVVNVFIAHLIKPITQARILWFWSVLFSQTLQTIKQPRPWPISLGFRRAIKAIGILMEFFVWAKRFDVNDFLLVLSFMTVVFVRGYVMIAQSWFFVNCEKPTLKAN